MSGSPLTIANVRPATSGEWDEVWAECEYATYFHSRAWAEIWEEYTQGKTRRAPRRVTFSDGAEAILPFVSKRILMGFAQHYISSPAGAYGGWIATDALSARHVKLLTCYILGHYPNLTWRLNPYSDTRQIVPNAKSDFTHRIALNTVRGDARRLQSKGHRSAVSKAIRAGLTIERANDKSDWDAYYDVYLDSLARWGNEATSRYDKTLFAIIRKRAQEAGHVDLWLAKDGTRIIAGALCLGSKHINVYWHGASLEAYFSKRPANLLFTRILEHYAHTGLHWFDFNPSGGHDGVTEFKRRFGAEPAAADIVTTLSGTMRHLSRLAVIRRTAR